MGFLGKFFTVSILSFLLGVVITFATSSHEQKARLQEVLSSSYIFSFNQPSSKLRAIVDKNLEGQKGEYAVLVKKLAGEKEAYSFNTEAAFPAASLYKLFLMSAAMEEIESGNITADTIISYPIDSLRSMYGGTDYGYEEVAGTVSYTVEECLTRIASISDNFAALMLAEKIGWDKVRQQPEKVGAGNTTIKDPITTTAEDISAYLEKLYEHSFQTEDRLGWLSPDSANKIIELLSASKLNNRIPAKLPKIKIAHKTGELSRVRHDAGIVYLSQATGLEPYIIILMSKDLEYEDDAIEILANISKDVYDYFVSSGTELGDKVQ